MNERAAHQNGADPGGTSSTAADPETITRLLRGGSIGADETGELGALVYGDLRRLAAGLLRRERPGHTLQPTALVHEAWLRLADSSNLTIEEMQQARCRFLGHAVVAMRRILIDHARARAAAQRSPDPALVPAIDLPLPTGPDAADLLDLDAALVDLASRRPRIARVAELRIYGGLSIADAAQLLGVSLTTAKGDWALAQALLSARLGS